MATLDSPFESYGGFCPFTYEKMQRRSGKLDVRYDYTFAIVQFQSLFFNALSLLCDNESDFHIQQALPICDNLKWRPLDFDV